MRLWRLVSSSSDHCDGTYTAASSFFSKGGLQKIENVAFPSSGERQRHDALHRDDMFSSTRKNYFQKTVI